MKKYLFLFSVAMVCLFIFAPQDSLAYFSTNQTSTLVGDSYVLFTITYNFGFQKYDGWLPIGAVRGLDFGNPSPYLGYTIIDKNGDSITTGKTAGLVLSEAKIIEGKYFIPKGTATSFTFVALLNTSGLPLDKKVALRVTSLPFLMTNDAVEIKAKMNPSELQYYTTPLTEFGN